MLYRIKQFCNGLTAKLNLDDIDFINRHLNIGERKIFFKLPIYEQVHCLKVARDVEVECNKNNIEDVLLIKASLLHDVGKIDGGLNLINKSIFVLLNKVFPCLLKKLIKFKAVNTFYNHPEMALGYIEDDNVKYLIKNHHNYNMRGDRKLRILQDADSRN